MCSSDLKNSATTAPPPPHAKKSHICEVAAHLPKSKGLPLRFPVSIDIGNLRLDALRQLEVVEYPDPIGGTEGGTNADAWE